MLRSVFSQLLFQSRCMACDRTASDLFCQSCAQQLLSGRRSQTLTKLEPGEPFLIFTWANYDGVLRRMMSRLKYEHQSAIGPWLGQQLAQSWLQTGLLHQYPNLVVVPIPMHLSKQKLRGYNQAELISRSFAQQVGYAHAPQALRRDRETQAQYALNAIDRQQNLQSAFSVAPKFSTNKPILLVDDICTTGATLRSAMNALQDRQLKIWGSAVVARSKFEKPV